MSGPIAVYGATGYTGRLVVRELARRGLDLVLSGRSEDRLRALARELEVDAPIRAAAADDVPALRRVLEDCAALVNCAGPFSQLGEPVVRAAIESATHYVDTTGEQAFIQRIFETQDRAARSAGVAVVPSMGFDYLPGDLLCGLVARDREPLADLTIAYAVSGFSATRGTMRSALEVMRGGDLVYRGGDWRPAGLAPLRATFPFPDPVGRVPVTRYPSGEVVTVPRHVRTRQVTSLIGTSAFAPHPALAPVVPLAMPGVSLALRTPLRGALSAAIGRLPEGPSEEQRRRASFTLVAVARGEDGSRTRGVVRGSDPYGLTAAIAVHGASLMAGAGYDRAGVLPPSSAYEAVPFLNYLGDHGVSYEVGAPTREPAADPVPTA